MKTLYGRYVSSPQMYLFIGNTSQNIQSLFFFSELDKQIIYS